MKTCTQCPKPLPPRRRFYCSDACKQRAYRLRSRKYPDSRAVEEPFEPESLKPSQKFAPGHLTGKRESKSRHPLDPTYLTHPTHRFANHTLRQRRGSRLRVRDDVSVRESLTPGVPARHYEPDIEAIESEFLTPEEQWKDICDAARARDEDGPGAPRLLMHYGRHADPWLLHRITLVLHLASPYPWAWSKALDIAHEDELVAVTRCVLRRIGVENFMRAHPDHSPGELSKFLGGDPSRATLYRIQKRIKEERMNTAVVMSELADIKESLHRIEFRQLDEKQERDEANKSLLPDEDKAEE